MSRTRIESLKVIIQQDEDSPVRLKKIYHLLKETLEPLGIEVMNVSLERERGLK